MLRVTREGAVVVWTIDRPRERNALDHATLRALFDAVGEAATDPSVRAAILTGAGEVFVSGGDLRELRQRHAVEDAEQLSDAGYALTTAIAELPFPVIAALSGPAIGGGVELAIACDLRVADARARLCLKQVRLGVTTAWGTVPRLISLVGAGAAARLLYTAEELDAAQAERLGLVDEVTGHGLATSRALAWAADISRGSPRAVADMKRLVRATTNDPRLRNLERRLFIDDWSGPDHRDAVEAFFERREPRWNPR